METASEMVSIFFTKKNDRQAFRFFLAILFWQEFLIDFIPIYFYLYHKLKHVLLLEAWIKKQLSERNVILVKNISPGGKAGY